jgi:hypothetical protein
MENLYRDLLHIGINPKSIITAAGAVSSKFQSRIMLRMLEVTKFLCHQFTFQDKVAFDPSVLEENESTRQELIDHLCFALDHTEGEDAAQSLLQVASDIAERSELQDDALLKLKSSAHHLQERFPRVQYPVLST